MKQLEVRAIVGDEDEAALCSVEELHVIPGALQP
jgi:hypothetical protein